MHAVQMQQEQVFVIFLMDCLQPGFTGYPHLLWPSVIFDPAAERFSQFLTYHQRVVERQAGVVQPVWVVD